MVRSPLSPNLQRRALLYVPQKSTRLQIGGANAGHWDQQVSEQRNQRGQITTTWQTLRAKLRL